MYRRSLSKVTPETPHSGMEVRTLLFGDATLGISQTVCAGVTRFYGEDEYVSALHTDTEGIFVLHGSGQAHVGDECFSVHTGDGFLVPPQTPHSLRCAEGCMLEVYWFHTGTPANEA